MRRFLPLLVLIAVVGAGLPASAAPPVTETQAFKDVTETFIDVVPTCDFGGALYEITITYNGVEHVTAFDDGRIHVTFTQTGTFEAVPLDPADPAASGHFTVWGGFNLNKQSANGTFTFNVNGSFDDGTKISTHFVDHFNETPTGAAFFFTHCKD